MAKYRNTQTTPHASPETPVFCCQNSGGAKCRCGRSKVEVGEFDK